jgi:hypothetical protein
MRRNLVIVTIAAFFCGPMVYAQWPANKSYDAGPLGSPNPLHFSAADGAFPGWAPGDAEGLTELTPVQVVSVGSPPETGASSKLVGVGTDEEGKVKYRNTRWGVNLPNDPNAFQSANNVKTGFFWRLFIASGETTRWPSISIRTHNYNGTGVNLNYGLAFRPDVTGGSWCTPLPGWEADGDGPEELPVQIDFGGKIIPAGPNAGKRYLPMSMDQWHSLRVEVRPYSGTGAGIYDVYLDEEQGGSDVYKCTLSTLRTKNGPYVEFGVRSSENNCRFYTHAVAWGQDIPGQNAQIPDLPFTQLEECANGTDDDGDGLADCFDSQCACIGFQPENDITSCSNGLDDDADGMIDCNDPDCAGVSHCGDGQPQFVVTSIRQMGHGQGGVGDYNWPGENGGTSINVYVSVYDENGQPVPNLEIRDPLNCTTLGTHSDNGQQGFYRQIGLIKAVDRTFMITKMNGSPVNSEVAKVVGNPADNDFGWLIEFMKKSAKTNSGTFDPHTRVFDYSGVVLHAAGGGANLTLNRDACNTGGADSPGAATFIQTFKVPADVNRIVSARFMTQIGGGDNNKHSNKVSIHALNHVPPRNMDDLGQQIGPTMASPDFTNDASAFIEQMLLWPVNGPNAIIVTPGEYYAAKIERNDPAGVDFNMQRLRNGNWSQDIDTVSGLDRIVGLRMLTDNYTLQYDDGTNATGGPAGVPNYDYRGYIVGGHYSPCSDPVFDVRTAGGQMFADGLVEAQDLVALVDCATGPSGIDPVAFEGLTQECRCMDVDQDFDVDMDDFAGFQRCYTGSNDEALGVSCDGAP